ncbi:fibronectin type III domain-containing protein [Nakamurella leprariae]|uniref:Fibronectin type III domain-containing protein n=1 Tax=Nakamurella leprariae TaxID=2803911 RepID=A0A938YFS3_9ACTN|nr:fibronectin type III domain-containing protein [Nakamurella leprariae]MBM9467339.1 fibronectin type III domain-containing protein [Nakamurella leprariae]
MRALRLFLALALTVGIVSPVTLSATAPPAVAAVPPTYTDALVGSLDYALDLAVLSDRTVLVATKAGVVRSVRNGALQPAPVLDLSARLCGNYERGLLGIATDPAAATGSTQYLWAFWTARDAGGTCAARTDGAGPNPATAPRNRVSRFTLRPDGTADPASERVLLDGIYSSSGYHNAGDIDLGRDGLLYIATGDGMCDYRGDVRFPGGSGCGPANDTARDRNVLNAKILRITQDGGIPADNPFQGPGTASCATAPAADGVTCQETFATGLRNPFRLAFDPDAGGTSFRINDVGQDTWDEIDQGVRGADYGWNLREGHCQLTNSETNCGAATPAGLTDPVFDYGQSTGCTSITGGAYVPSGTWPAYAGSYLFADYTCGTIFALSPDNVRTEFATGLDAPLTIEFGPDGAGQALYYATPTELRRITATGSANRAPTAVVTTATGPGATEISFDGTGSTDPDGDALSYRWTFGDGTPTVTTTTPSTTHTYASVGAYTVTLQVTDPGGLSSQATASVQAGNAAPVPTILSPTATDLFSVGTTYTLRGSATDAEDGTLPASSLSWTVIKHHATHTHPVIGPVSGATTTITGPAPEDPASTTDSWLEIQLTATDSRGVSTTVRQDFRPRTVPVTVASDPAGLKVTLNGTVVSTPTTITSWANWAVPVNAAPQTDGSGRAWTFTRWSDGGAASHAFITPATPTTLTATFTAAGPTAPPAPSRVTATQTGNGAATLTWSPSSLPAGQTVTGYRVARDGVDSTGYGAFSTVVPATSRSFGFGRLVVGRTYTLTVQAVTAAGTGTPATATVAVRAWTLPAGPTAVTVVPTGGSAATISWSPPTDSGGQPITGYRVTRDGTDSSGTGPWSTVLPASATRFVVSKLVAWRTYTLTVSAITAVGSSPAHGAQVLVGSQQGVPAPTKVTVVQATGTTQRISWEPPTVPAGITLIGWTVTRDGKDSNAFGPWSTTVGPSARSVTVRNLVPGRTYTMTVQARTTSWFSAIAHGSAVIR